MRYMPYDQKALAAGIKDYVDRQRNYRDPSLTSAGVAKALGIARSTLIKVMSEEMSTTFATYLWRCRVHHAHHLMKTKKGRTDYENVALLVGFRTTETLRRKFREEYGIRLEDI